MEKKRKQTVKQLSKQLVNGLSAHHNDNNSGIELSIVSKTKREKRTDLLKKAPWIL